MKKEDKTLAVGMQFMLLRVLGKLLAQGPQWWRWATRCLLCAGPVIHRHEWDLRAPKWVG